MTVTLEAEISPGVSPGDFVDLAVRCERAGFDRFGVSDVVFWPDCFVLQGLIAQATSRIHIGSMVTNPYSRHPAMAGRRGGHAPGAVERPHVPRHRRGRRP